MIMIEMKLAGELDFTTVMINMEKISEVSEFADSVQLTMASGNTYHVTKDTFHAAISSVEGVSYLKFKTGDEPEAVEPVEDVVDAVFTEDTISA